MGDVAELAEGFIFCAKCEEPLSPDWWRWRCLSCGRTTHYRCVEGGVPLLNAPPPCPACGGEQRGMERHSDDAQGNLFG